MYSTADDAAYRIYTYTVRKVVTYPYFHPEDGGSSYLWNVCAHQ
jgi:hypothetical protein